jgi:Response regulator containing a CheY-like receiver domain and an HTH DNA-binding domain
MPPIRVMIVDDTLHVRNMLSSMLTIDGFEVVGSFGSGQEAIDAVVELDPDVAVIDYKMPTMDGIETARRMRDVRPGQAMIMYTAFLHPELEAEAAEAGVAVCLAKVEGLASLEHEISRLCSSLF